MVHCHRIYRDIALREFPWDINASLAMALYRDFAVPEISQVLASTGKMERHAGDRMNDTASLLFEILNYGYDHPRGICAIRQINRIHRQVALLVNDPSRTSLMSNDNFIYVLGTFLVPSIRWIDRYGWRPLTENERTGMFAFYRGVGTRLGVKGIPATYPAFIHWFDAYEQRNLSRGESNRKLWDATQTLLATKMAESLPKPFIRPARPLCRKLADWITSALLDDAVRAALGAPRSPALARAAILAGLNSRRRIVRCMRPRNIALIPRGILVTASKDGAYPPAGLWLSTYSRITWPSSRTTLARRPRR